MKTFTFLLLLAVAASAGAQTQAIACPPIVASSPAALIVAKALELMGSAEALCTMRAISYKAVGHRLALEQSPRPEGPYFTTYDQLQVTLDFEHQRYRQQMT